MKMKETCSICDEEALNLFFAQNDRSFLRCSNCLSIFLEKACLLNHNEEKSHYDWHNNDVFDEGYRSFTSPISNVILASHSPKERGLDFGAGPGPVISQVLSEHGYQVALYDPFYHKNDVVFSEKFDFIFACEVVEHFHDPMSEFLRLYNLLLPNGKLYLMTHLFNDSVPVNFEDWYYKNDPTHAVIYHDKSIAYIAKKIGFIKHTIEGRLITLFK